MTARFFGTWPTDEVGNPLVVKIEAPKFAFKDSHKDALTRAGKDPNKVKPQPPTPDR